MALRRGRQYLREISGDGQHFGLPHIIGDEIRSVVPWSRIFNDQEMLLAINTDPDQPHTAWVIVDYNLHVIGDRLQCLYTTGPHQEGQELTITDVLPNMKAVLLTVPAAGFVIYE
jgi:hypothetical protein